MAKKKSKNKEGQKFMSPKKYIVNRARTLEIGKCYYSDRLFDLGEGQVIVSRIHTGGNITAAIYLVDVFCLGVKDSLFKFRMEPQEWEDMIQRISDNIGLNECSYEEAHNIIWGAVDFAEEGGIRPNKSFSVTQYMLKEDTDDVPLIEYDFGKDGKHFLVANNPKEASEYLPKLKAALGNDFKYMVRDDRQADSDSTYQRDPSYGKLTQYTYQPPKEYIAKPTLHNPWLVEELSKKENAIALSDSLVDRILALPHDDLREDLEQIILYYMGYTQDGNVPDDYDNGQDYNGMLATSIMLLAEVGNDTSSLDVVLEVLRQSEGFFDYHFCDAFETILVPTVYKLGHNQLDKLFDYMKEKGLYTYAKPNVSDAVMNIAWLEPERKAEVVDWYKKVLQFATEKLPEVQYIDGVVAGSIAYSAIDVNSTELLPYIKDMYDTGCVDTGIAGSYREVKEEIENYHRTQPVEPIILDIHERFKRLRRIYGK